MELTWINKLRIAAVAGLGIVVMGILAWPLAAPADPLMPVRASNVSASGTLLLIVLAFAIGLAGYFIAWPHGREIGILGVPFGLVIWAGRSGPMRALTQAYQETAERAALVHSLRLEPAYWLLLVAAGFAGVLLAQYLRRPGASETSHSGPQSSPTAPAKTRPNTALYVNCAIAVVVAVVISQFFVGVFVQNLAMSHGAAAQPAIGQIIFGVAAAFAVAAFVVKRFLDLSYLWPAVASLFIVAVAETLHYNAEMIRQFAETYPAPLFPHSVFAILPVQLVTLGTLGSVLGYWMAVRYDYWRKHETG